MLDWERFQDKKICVALSGGVDSVVLLHRLRTKGTEYRFSLSAVHCEHGIRGEESLRDMRFVQKLCAEWGVPLHLFTADCPALAEREKTSLETAARNFRRDCFRKLLEGAQADFIATAHHQGDEAETVLFRMARGSALGGAVAMREQDGRLLRPLLGWSKSEILAYAQTHGLAYCVDSTNLQMDATRNKIRLEILPKLEEAVSGATGNIARFAALAAEDDGFLYELSEELLFMDKERVCVRFSERKPLFTRACLTALKRCGLTKDYTAAHLNALFALQVSERGATLTLPKNIRAERAEKGLAFYSFVEEEATPLGEVVSFRLGRYDGGRYEVNVQSEPFLADNSEWKILRLDMDKLPKGTVFRFRREGDTIERFGGGNKSLKKFFNEEKIPPKERGYLPLLANPDGGEVFAVCGVEISERVKIDEGTRRVAYISLRRKE